MTVYPHDRILLSALREDAANTSFGADWQDAMTALIEAVEAALPITDYVEQDPPYAHVRVDEIRALDAALARFNFDPPPPPVDEQVQARDALRDADQWDLKRASR